MERITNMEDLAKIRQNLQDNYDENKTRITICGGTGCRAFGAEELMAEFSQELIKLGLEDKIEVMKTGCHGFCERGPIVVILPDEIFYQHVKTKDVPEIINETLLNKNIIKRLLYVDPVTKQPVTYDYDVPFYKKQKRLVFKDNGRLDPTIITDYIRRDGYKALSRVFTSMTQEQVIEEITKSGLRGRGGAGFPTGVKWKFTRAAKGDIKYIICNGDEGDPGAFMDRSVLEGNPHLVIEGMLIGAYAIGSKEGYVYVRAEYPLAVKHLRIAILQAEETGLLGDNILGTNFCFHLHIKEGAGAFVCGEETALIASVEGKRGMPRPRPPFPANEGLWGNPTCINNVETFANISSIILNGADWYASMGTEKSKGTKIFALAGKINNTGLVEVPMGTTLRKVIYEIGGGIPKGKKFKAVQMGGPSGGCVPEKSIDLPIDYESLQSVGAIMGSGGMIVMDETTCMVDIARYFMNFVQNESCGKCVPCRLGTKRMLEILIKITKGQGTADDIETLKDLAYIVKDASLCGLGQTGPNPVLSTIAQFYDEYMAHIKDKKCPAGVCTALITFRINQETCSKCGLCKKSCSQEAISGSKTEAYVIDINKCIKCRLCYVQCPTGSVETI